jgi:hypothetical protein
MKRVYVRDERVVNLSGFTALQSISTPSKSGVRTANQTDSTSLSPLPGVAIHVLRLGVGNVLGAESPRHQTVAQRRWPARHCHRACDAGS